MDFVFVDGWRFFSSKGNYVYLTKDDLLNYKENGLTEDEIKTSCYSYLTSNSFFDFSNMGNIENEF